MSTTHKLDEGEKGLLVGMMRVSVRAVSVRAVSGGVLVDGGSFPSEAAGDIIELGSLLSP